ncbi:DUF3298 domain-containing protein [bacterium]|nr:DUF3298 domain-containing protein [bacterium]
MKKIFFALLVILLAAGAFFAGRLSNSHEEELFDDEQGFGFSNNLVVYLAALRDCCLTGQCNIATQEITNSFMLNWEASKELKPIYADEDHVSYMSKGFYYTGGAHGITAIDVGTIDRKSGKILRIDDVWKKEEQKALLTKIRELVVKELQGEEHLLAEPTLTENFYLSSDGWHFVFNQYEVACYADGIIEVVVEK